MTRVYNFCAGPAAIPESVLQQAQTELLDYRGMGASVMEITHRGPEFMAMAAQAEQDVRDLLNVPDHYRVLFVQGGASLQFSMAPLNLFGVRTLNGKALPAEYINTGVWSEKAIEEAKRFGHVEVIADATPSHWRSIPEPSSWQTLTHAAYCHYTPNETIQGLEFSYIPDRGDIPLVADMSSTIFSRPMDVSKFGVIYAGAQKNIGPSGLTLVIVREDLMAKPLTQTPQLLRYQTYADHDSMFNTPPTFSWYLSGLVFKWLKAQGGLEAMAVVNQRKAQKLYQFIDGHDFYTNHVETPYRSWMNVPFTLADESKEKLFLQESQQAGLLNLKGHRIVGGMRASIYNAVPEAAIDALIAFMQDFAARYA